MRGAAGAAAAALPGGLGRGQLKRSIAVGAQRGAGGEVRLTAVPGQDAVVLDIAGGPSLVLHPESARDLLLAQQGEMKRSADAKGNVLSAPDEVTVSARLQWRGLEERAAARDATRGFLGDVLLAGVHVVSGIGTGKAADLVADGVVGRFDGQVDEGLYQLRSDALTSLKGSQKAKLAASSGGPPLLIFLHGTFSDTPGTFGKLWSMHPGLVQSLFTRYGDRVYGFDRATLGVSPMTNALNLAKALPAHATLHFVTHSGGGLVAEILARVCAEHEAILNNGLPTGGASGTSEFAAALKALAGIVKRKQFRVERVVRVACPARGTLLASKRLDAYLSVFKWTLELAGVPVAPALVDFLGEVAQRRADPTKMPGLAAQIPDSPLVQWLHAVEKPIEGDVRVVAGDIEGDSVTSWLKTLLADAFYWTDNDLIVHTRSMYGGAPRADGATFVLDQGGKVSHFTYFANDFTADAIVRALLADDPSGFRTIGPLSWAGESSTGVRAARPFLVAGKPSSERPAVFLLPGILGSNLKVNGERVWLGWRSINGLKLLEYNPDKRNGVEPDGSVSLVYDRLAEFLSETHEVVEFAFDWRKPMEGEAQRLAKAVELALDAREKSGQPVRILAHSMGGIVARVMHLERPDVWQRMMSRAGARLLMLGTPNEGTWVPMQVLSGDETFGNTLGTFGGPLQGRLTRHTMAGFPGLLQLQARLLDERLGLGRADTWRKLAENDFAIVREQSWWHDEAMQREAYEWGIPSQQVLDQATALRKRLDQQRDSGLTPFLDRLLLVVGTAPLTPDGYEFDDEGLRYRDVQDSGDGRVTWASARLPGVHTWMVTCEHNALPSDTESFKGYRELLETGTTSSLRPVPVAADPRDMTVVAPAHVRWRPSRSRTPVRPPEITRDLLSGAERDARPVAAKGLGTALRVTVVNGDLKFVRQPLLIGHYRAMRLTGTESVMNKLVGNVMKESLQAGLYPDVVGSHQVFLNTRWDPDVPRSMPWPEAVIVVGLGEEGKLRATDLVQAVRQGTIAWAQRVTEKADGAPAVFDLSATLIGSGGISITPGQSAQLVAEGVREANQQLAESQWPLVGHLQLIEIYLDRATEAWRALQVQASAAPAYYQIADTIQSAPGALLHTPDQGYRGVDYDFITVLAQKGTLGETELSYALDTKRARTEVRAVATQSRLLRNLVVKASNDRSTDLDIRRALFRLLVPVELEAFLGGTSDMIIELDGQTAGIPWELLDTDLPGSGDKRPWAIRAKLVRKLRTVEFRPQVTDAGTEESVLIIGEPECDPTLYPRLPGARHEARAVHTLLTNPGELDGSKVTPLISADDPQQVGSDALTITNTLLARNWRIVHIAGHGEPPEKLGPEPKQPGDPEQRDGDPRGVVLSGGTFLGPREIRAMRIVPELVFVNCCHLAARNIAQLTPESNRLRDLRGLIAKEESKLGQPYDRPRFAATVAEELIKIGVRCVIAAGWAVDDAAAKLFATTFYSALLRRRRFIEAVGEAREAAWSVGGNTWAAYQCYGDPDWVFRREGMDAQRPVLRPAERFVGIASPSALKLALDTLAVESQYQKAASDEQRARIRFLEAQFGERWGKIGSVAEAFGWAWAQANDKGAAVSWYQKALQANDGTASIKAVEQLRYHQVRVAWEPVEQALDRQEGLLRQEAARPRARGRNRASNRAAQARAGRDVAAAARTARRSIMDTIGELKKLGALHVSSEREILLGSAYKRLGMIDGVEGRSTTGSVRRMAEHYGAAETLARAAGLPDFFYPALNRMAADLVLNRGRTAWKGFDPASVSVVRRGLETKLQDDPDFWSAVGLIEIRLYQALAGRNAASDLARLQAEYEDLHHRVSAAWMWEAVKDQLQFLRLTGRFTEREQAAMDKLFEKIRMLAARKDSPISSVAGSTSTSP